MTRKFLATILAIAMVITSMGTVVFADETVLGDSSIATELPEAVDGVITLTEDVKLPNDTRFPNEMEINLNGHTLYVTKSVTFNATSSVYGGIINADEQTAPDGLIRVNYHHTNDPVSLTLTDVTVSALNSVYSTGVFYLHTANNTLTLDNVTVNVSGGNDDPGSGVFYSPSSFNRGNVILENGTSVTTDKTNAIFFATEVNISDSTLDCDNVYRPVFRQASGSVEDTTITVESIEDGRALIEDVSGQNSGIITFRNSTITAPENVTVAKFNNEGSAACADKNSSLGNGSGVVSATVSVGGKAYVNLAAAIDAADETNNEITLLCDASGDGVVIDKDIIIDLDGYTYTINGTLVGSRGTETIGFQILRDNDVTIKNGTILGSKDAIKGNESKEANGLRILIQNYSNLTLEDVTLDYGDADKIGYVLSNNYGEIALTGETSIIAPAGKFAFDVYDYTSGGYPSAPEMTINTTGVINGAFEVSETAGLEIESGYFTHNPSAYLAEGMAAVTSDSSNAKFMIAEKKVDVETTVTPSSPSVSVEEGIEINTDNFAADTDDLNAASSTLANDSSVVGTKEDATAALEDAEITVTEDDTVSVVVVPYTNINVSNVDNENKTMTVTIEPKYDVIATTNSDEIIIEGDGKNAVVLNSNQTLNVNTPMTLTVALPADYAGEDEETVYVHHEIDGTTYVYEAALSADKTTATFTNINGFSSTEFVVKKEAGAAKIGDVIYATLSDAVKNVKNDETIVLLADNAETVKVAKTITFSLDKDVHAFTGAIDNGSYTKVTTTENGNVITYTFKYTSGSLGGGGGASGGGGGGAVVSAYTIKVKSADNGTVTASSKTAKKGATITLSVTADEGYEIESITVTDNDNEEVAVTEDNGEYSFKMPASDVVVTAEFVAEGTVETPDDNETNNFPFADIAEDFWGYEAIAYCFENGIMNGMTETEFDQARPLTRAMLVTMLYRLAGTPEVVTDEADWWSTAKAWAMECGISDGTFMTEEVTREQLVTMLYRYAGMIEADLTATAELTSFTDSASISDYAVDSVKWAYASELINGMGDGTFAPTSSATRAQVATIFMRFIENIVK